MTKKQLVIGDGKQGRPYPEDRWPDARISNRNLLAAIRSIQEKLSEQASMIGRLADMEERITDNADKAHAEIGARIDKLGDHLDRMDDDLKEVKGGLEHLNNRMEEHFGG